MGDRTSASYPGPASLRLRPEPLKVCLLVWSQFVLDAYQKADLRAFNLPFGTQYLVQLTHHLRLVGGGLLQKGDQGFHGVLKLPLKLGESGLSLQQFDPNVGFLRVAEVDPFL